jgi:anti-sigma-K factor RskA
MDGHSGACLSSQLTVENINRRITVQTVHTEQAKSETQNDQSKKSWRYGSSSRALALKTQSLEFKPLYCPSPPTKK